MREVETGGEGGIDHVAEYALVAGGGLDVFGVYVEVCSLSACRRGDDLLRCLYPAPPALASRPRRTDVNRSVRVRASPGGLRQSA